MRIYTVLLMAGIASTIALSPAKAEEKILYINKNDLHSGHSGHGNRKHIHNDYAPAGVMGSHMHKAGDFMFSYRTMRMNMDGNRMGTHNLDPITIATTHTNRFSGVTGQPATLRVVPTDMTMDMHMLGAMYAPTEWLTFMVMANYLKKEMNHITFAGGAGTSILGNFTTKSEGWGDTKISGLVRLFNDDTHHAHFKLGLSLPTGAIDKMGTVLAPTGATPHLRLPYAMQLGTGTIDLLLGTTYTGRKDAWGWGAQYAAAIHLESENEEGYSWGDKHSLTAWGSYEWAPWISTSLRLTAYTQDSIDGIDPKIVAPVQTADPDNYGGNVVEYGLGVNLMGTNRILKDHRLAFEITAPLYRDPKGLQLETDWTVTVSWQYTF